MRIYLTSVLASYILSIMMVGGLYLSLPKYSYAGWLDDAKKKALELKKDAAQKAREKANKLRRQASELRDRAAQEARKKADRLRRQASELKDRTAQKAREKADRLRKQAAEKAAELGRQAREKAKKLKDDARRKAADAAKQLRRDIERKAKKWEVEEKAEKAKAYLDEQAQKTAKAIGGEMYRSHRSLDKAKEAWGDPKTPEQRRAALRRAKKAFMKEHKITNEKHFEALFNKRVDEHWAKASRENRRVMKAMANEIEREYRDQPLQRDTEQYTHRGRPWEDNTSQADRVLKKFADGIEAICSWCGEIISNAYHCVIGFFSGKDYVEYTVKKGDSLSSIAKDRTGNWLNWQEIMKYNKKHNSKGFDEHLDIGEKVYIPKDMLRK